MACARVLPNLPIPLRVGIANMLSGFVVMVSALILVIYTIYQMEREAIRSHELFRTRLRLAWCFESTSNEPTFQQPKEAATIRAHQNRHASKFGVHFSILISYTWTLPLTYLVLGVKQGIAKILHHRGSNPGTNPCQSGEMVCLDLYLL